MSFLQVMLVGAYICFRISLEASMYMFIAVILLISAVKHKSFFVCLLRNVVHSPDDVRAVTSEP